MLWSHSRLSAAEEEESEVPVGTGASASDLVGEAEADLTGMIAALAEEAVLEVAEVAASEEEDQCEADAVQGVGPVSFRRCAAHQAIFMAKTLSNNAAKSAGNRDRLRHAGLPQGGDSIPILCRPSGVNAKAGTVRAVAAAAPPIPAAPVPAPSPLDPNLNRRRRFTARSGHEGEAVRQQTHLGCNYIRWP